MSFLRTLGRLATGFAASRIDNAIQGDEVRTVRHDLRSGETTSGTRRVGGLTGEPDYDGDGRSSIADRQRARDEGGFRARGLMNMIGDVGGAVRDAGGLGAFVENAKEHAMGALDEYKARLLIQAMILAAKADGEIDATERGKIIEHIDDAGEDEQAFVIAEIEQGTDLRAFLKSVPPDPDFRKQVYLMSLMAIDVDTPEEEAYMADLAKGLGLSEADIAEVTSS